MALWSAVVMSWCEGIYRNRWIVCLAQPEQYVRRVAKDVSQSIHILVEHYAEAVNLAGLEDLHASFGTGPYPVDGWSLLNVDDLLERLPDIAVAEYQESGSPAAESSFWYTQLVGFLNETFPDDDGVWINIERPFASRTVLQSDGFLSALLDLEASGVKEVHRLSEQHAGWLGRLAVLSRLTWDPPVPKSLSE
jgi:hypothetical protein